MMSLVNVRIMFSASFLLAILTLSSPTWAHPQHVAHSVHQQRRDACENTAESRNCWGSYNIDTDYYDVVPDTGVTREYWLLAQNKTLAPDGYERTVLTFNGTFPGPKIEADWGDNLVIHVTNNLENNGTTVHWHGIRQLGTNQYDGVPGVTQCPIAPGQTMTYKFRATQYGTSWYHSHFSVQLGDGLYGPLVINGPATANYDEDLGPVFVSDWFHQTAYQLWDLEDKYGGFPVRSNSVPDNGLFNGTNVYECQDSDGAACAGTGARSEARVTKGKKYRLRIIDTQLDGWMKFSIDGHQFTVIANDFVPIVPYTTDTLILGAGQRYDVIVEMNQTVGNYWMRAIYQSGCNLLSRTDQLTNNVLGILRYDGADTSALPTTTRWSDALLNSCGDEPYDKLTPYLSKNVGTASEQTTLDIQTFYETNLVFHWALNTRDLLIDWEKPTNLLIYQNESTPLPAEYNIYSIPAQNQWTYWIIQDLTLLDAYHPFHLHGHDFYILAQGQGLYNTLAVRLNLVNPPRRDTATLPGDGYLVIAFPTDNPGSWLLHCHIMWHASQSLALQFIEREDEIVELVEQDYSDLSLSCIDWTEFYEDSLYKQDDSGI